MNNENYIWENDRFRKDPYKVPEGYFEGFPDRLMDRLNQSGTLVSTSEKQRMIRPWMAWVSGIAAVMVLGWFGVRNFYWKPLQEVHFQENITLFVDYYGEELHEGELAGFLEDNKIDLTKSTSNEVNVLIQIEPDLAEEYIFESVGF